MYKHNFIYSIIEEFVKINSDILNTITKVKLNKEKDMLTSYKNKDITLNNFIENKLKDIFKKHNLKLKSSWAQKYLKGNFHSLHIHDVHEKSFVWFIKGDKDSSPLDFYDIGYPFINTKQKLQFKFIPGTLLIFPGFIPHEVKPNKNNDRLIVSGNVI